MTELVVYGAISGISSCQVDHVNLVHDIRVFSDNISLFKRMRTSRNRILFNRRFKFFDAKCELADCDWSLYVDHNIKPLISDLSSFIDNSYDMIVYNHPVRRTVGEELNALYELGYVSRTQVKLYLTLVEQGLSLEDELWEGNIIFRKRSQRVVQFNEEVYGYLRTEFPLRDQLYMPFLARKFNLRVKVIRPNRIRSDDPYFRYFYSRSNQPFDLRAKRAFQRFLNRR